MVTGLTDRPLEDVILTAIRSEIDAAGVYQRLADRVRNAFLKDRMVFLAKEELKHRAYLESLYGREFPGKALVVPKRSPIPLPEVTLEDERAPVSDVLTAAMKAEEVASEYYRSMAKLFKKNKEVHSTLVYFSFMERGHYQILEAERRNVETLEDYDMEWPMMHAGP